jgi:arylamine N-acetyltransferase
MLDLDAYLGRVDLEGRPNLARLHRAHVTAVPFENLDPRRGIPISLEPDDLERKLVSHRRGGYCFGQNLLLNWFTCTYPRSPFVTGLIVSTHRPDGMRESLNDLDGALSLTEETPVGATVIDVEPDAVPKLVATRFGLEATLV